MPLHNDRLDACLRPGIGTDPGIPSSVLIRGFDSAAGFPVFDFRFRHRFQHECRTMVRSTVWLQRSRTSAMAAFRTSAMPRNSGMSSQHPMPEAEPVPLGLPASVEKGPIPSNLGFARPAVYSNDSLDSWTPRSTAMCESTYLTNRSQSRDSCYAQPPANVLRTTHSRLQVCRKTNRNPPLAIMIISGVARSRSAARADYLRPSVG